MNSKIPGIHIVATGHYAPPKVVTNDDLSKIVDTNDEWIKKRTGIERRHFSEGETNTDFAEKAARQALANSGIDVNDLAACIVATFSPDFFSPSVACLVHERLELPDTVPAFDVNAACSGFIYALEVARGMLLQSDKKYILVCGSELISRVLDMTDRGTCILFGDGAGAAVIELSEEKMYYSVLGTKGNGEYISVPNQENEKQKVYMDGTNVFKFAVRTVPQCIEDLLDKSGLTKNDITHYVCHQANRRILESVANKLELPIDKFYMNMMEYGNTSAASVPIALSEMNEKGMLKPGDKIISVGFGAGLTWAGVLIEW